MTLHFTPLWFIALPLLLAFLSPLWVRLRLLMPILLGAHVALFALALSWFPAVRTAPFLETIVIAPPLGIHLHLDAVSLLLIALFNLAGALVAAFVWLGNSEPHLRERPAFILILLLIAGSNGMVLTGDLFNLYVFLEISGVSAYALTALRRDKSALEAGLKYLIIGSVAAIFFLFAIVLLYLQTGQLNMAALARDFAGIPASMQILIGLLMLIGLGIKAELFPFNFWVPDIYRGADPEITALFSGVLVKAFLFVLFHLVFLLLADPTVARTWLMALGALTMIVAEAVALRQQDLRRMLAYSSLGQVGLITLALGFASEATTAGALFHMVNHTLIKLLLFLLTALMLRRFLSVRLAALQGLGRAMPLAAGLFVLGALAVLGLPPLSGFASKLWILKGFAEAQVFWPIALILLAALLEAGYYFRWIKVFYAPESPVTAGQPEGDWAYAPLLLIAGLLLLLGVAPFLLEDWFVQAARALLGRGAILESVLGVQP
ncbi:complex I subunit 5 family protein [Thiocystis violascens]|uniref:Formate hydrogenlyase subunit 3/multisubunit Na+/H+ antiporter, MnhD subunit n=1 Tax=Thiocystis violascens (strain ATCC 17096 / DSM 198 / 6111) TaxID=765911 RepID=I3Y7W6_THIV6|nr:proton-conducting transporter membrane subunit [Thiocystis violascens]AFL73084.1 formate hydrogenlyase subunit 3/multisubunit Na+/H+ antiporter, MnhD subunit [Thiocystis violascens DSM 198]